MEEKVYQDLMARFDLLADNVVALSHEYGPEVIEAGLMLARISAAQSLIVGFLLVATALVLYRGAYKFYKTFKALDPHCPDSDEYFFGWGTFLLAAAGTTLLIPAACRLFNIWNWVGLIEPKLWIARRLLDGVM